MKKYGPIVLFVFIAVVFWTCTKKNEQDLQKQSGVVACDTIDMQYTADILPIIQANCYSCHGNGLSQNGVSLDSYDKIKQQIDNGNLIGAITHAAGYPPMPQGAPQLSDCAINKIKDWIAHGTLNN